MQLKEYQQKVKQFILETPRCNIFLKCGMGKTFITLSVLDELLVEDPSSFPVLIVAPLNVARGEWDNQAKKIGLSSLKFSKIIGNVEQREKALSDKANIFLINYENLSWLINYCGKNFFFKTIICDESTKIKAHRISSQIKDDKIKLYRRAGGGTNNASALVSKCLNVKRWINLSGTPISNSIEDLWGQQFPLDLGESLGRSYTAFLEKYYILTPIKQGFCKKTLRKGADKAILEAVKPYTYSLESNHKDVIEVKIPVLVDDKIKKEYKKLKNDKFIMLKDDFVEDSANMKLRQLASGTMLDNNGNRHDFHNYKLDTLEELIKKLNTNIIVVYYFKHEMELILKRFPEAKVLNHKNINDWNSGKIPILLLHPKSAGHGLNLQYGGNVMIIYSMDWNSENYQQTIERIGQARQKSAGFDRDTYVYILESELDIDTTVINRVKNKIDYSIKRDKVLQK